MRVAVLIALCALLAACGHRGPLVPPKSAAPAPAAAPAALPEGGG